MWGRNRSETPKQLAASKVLSEEDQAEKEKENALTVAWKVGYDQDRTRAQVEGRGCGRCIEGVVKFGRNFDDQYSCTLAGVDCKFTKKTEGDTKIE